MVKHYWLSQNGKKTGLCEVANPVKKNDEHAWLAIVLYKISGLAQEKLIFILKYFDTYLE